MAVETFLAHFKDCPDVPEWGRTSFLDTDTGEVFLCAVMGEDERRVFFKVAFDGVGMIHDKGHLYVPVSWLKKEYPKHAAIFEKAARATLEAASKPSATNEE